jgi:nucleoside-diphosphate-sugar epimerase
MARQGTVLVTGGTGVLGAPLVARLAGDSTVCLTHESRPDCAARTVTGDLLEPRLGLAPGEYGALAREVEVVAHLAALTRFDTSRAEYFALNLEGTRRVLEFVADANARLLHVSTAFVDAERRPPSGFLDPGGYVESKLQSEEAVRTSGLDWHVVRPSVVVGSPGDAAPRRQGFHFFVEALINEQMPFLPTDEGTRMDFVAAELVAEVLELMIAAPPPGEVSFVTAGQDAWTVAEAVEVAMATFAEAGRRVAAPRLVPREMIERLLKPAFYDDMPRRYVRRFEQMDSIGTVLLTPRPFASTLDSLAKHYGRPLELDLEETFRVAVRELLARMPQSVA